MEQHVQRSKEARYVWELNGSQWGWVVGEWMDIWGWMNMKNKAGEAELDHAGYDLLLIMEIMENH